ncbi:hypothetical protein BIFANG_02736 [Bifidobacterium angulatum DSM 20098 = JCM 7096]|uniref:Uncharacterized protein n=1 Tax=Bifidobacterium angulatum DSM 20098 = JCM 7096 TaxID=518635 RepID=C4FEJ5_9BIFI|nr:hypothetical protein BIFANG_02736 [Bifidobacterium angulatum DSM 20098 = JCM 7096]
MELRDAANFTWFANAERRKPSKYRSTRYCTPHTRQTSQSLPPHGGSR